MAEKEIEKQSRIEILRRLIREHKAPNAFDAFVDANRRLHLRRERGPYR